MSRVLEAQDIAYAYERGRPVLRAVSVSVRPGVLLGILGPNGSGKSTLLRVLCGLLHCSAGRVTLGGKPVSGLPGRERARALGFLPQTVHPTFSLNAFEAVCLGRHPHRGALGGLTAADLAVARRCMRDTESEYLASRPFLSLSGGERQRVLLAGILAQEPALLLLDEPTSALDLHHAADVFALLRRLTRQDYGAAVVTHDLNLAAQFCDEVLLLSSDHAVAAAGPPEQVLTSAHLSAAYGAAIQVAPHPLAGTPLAAAAPRGKEAP